MDNWIEVWYDGNGFYNSSKGHGIIGGRKWIGVAKVNFVLTWSLLMVGALRLDAQFLQCQADLTAHIFSFVVRGHIHIAGIVIGDRSGIAVLIQFEQIEFHFGTKSEAKSFCLGRSNGGLQNTPGILIQLLAIRVGDVAEHSDHLSALWPPGELNQRGGIGPKE